MADEISVPIKLPTDTSSVSAAKGAVDGLAAGLKGLGPAAAAGAGKAKTELDGLAKAAAGAAAETRKYDSAGRARDEKGRFLGSGKRNQPVATEGGGVDLGIGAFDSRMKEQAKLAAKIRKEMAAADKEQLKKARKRAADMKELQSAALGAVGAVAAVASAVAAISVQFVRALVSVQAFRESTMGAFKALLGSASAADKAFKETIKTADQIGISYQEALGGVNKLIAKGFKADQAQELVKAMADLRAVVPDANIGNLLLAITQIKSKGVLQMEELQGQIAEAGLSVSVVLEEIGKGIGKSGAEVRKLISQGKISADQGVAGIMAAIQKTTGKPIGKAAEEASKSLGGLLSRLEQIPQGLLLMADASKGVSRLKDVLGNVLAAFAPSTKGGQALSAAIGRLGDAFASFLGGLEGAGGKATLQEFATGLALAADRAADLVRNIGLVAGPILTGFMKGFSSASKMLGGSEPKDTAAGYEALGKALGKVAEAVGFMATFFGAFGFMFEAIGAVGELTAGLSGLWEQIKGWIMTAAGAVGELTAGLSGLWEQIKGWIMTAAGAVGSVAQSIGSNLVQGIIAGIGLASPMLAAAIQGLASLSTNTMQGATKIASPSKLWRDEVGYQLPAGAAEGVYDGAPLMARAARDVAGLSTGAGASAAAGVATAGGATSGPISIVFNITGEGGRSVKQQVIEALQEVFGGELSYA